MDNSPEKASEAVKELDIILEHELAGPMSRALNCSGPLTGDASRHWRELGRRLRRAADLADWLANRKA
jgi:hypothetical protein